MQIYGNEYGFRFTVGAMLDLARLCPEGKIENLEALLGGSDADALEITCKMALALSRANDLAMRFEGAENDRPPLTMDMLLSLDCKSLAALKDELARVMKADGKPSVEVAPAKKKAAAKPQKSG